MTGTSNPQERVSIGTDTLRALIYDVTALKALAVLMFNTLSRRQKAKVLKALDKAAVSAEQEESTLVDTRQALKDLSDLLKRSAAS